MMSESVNELSGRELDAAVAERVMNLPEVEMRGDVAWYRDTQREEDYGGRWSTCVPPYSGSVEAATKVVEKIRQNFDVAIHTGSSGGWAVVLKTGNPMDTVTAGGPSLPDCICRVALAAVKTTQQ